MCDVYLYGQILGTHSFYLRDGFLQPDEYAELAAKYFLPGGETGSAATVLASLGVSVKMDGTHIGTEVAPMLREFYGEKPVDLSSLYFDPEYEGLKDDELVRFASACSAIAISRYPLPLYPPTLEEVEKKLQNIL